jgi:hypothetical protein
VPIFEILLARSNNLDIGTSIIFDVQHPLCANISERICCWQTKMRIAGLSSAARQL